MFNLSKRNTVVVAMILSTLMWGTRDHHAGTFTHLPDASWAIFFLLGFYFRQRMFFPLFLAQAAVIDYVAITQFGIDDYCVTPAYAFLLPAYFSLWVAGRYYAAHYRFHARSLLLFAAAAISGVAACELISSGSFHFAGGRVSGTSLVEFSSRLAQYFPQDLAGVAMYLGVAALAHVLIVGTRASASPAR